MKLLFPFLLLIFGISANGQDHSLDYYIAHAQNSSPLLADFRNQVNASQVDSQLLRAAQKIQVNGVSINYYAPTGAGWGYDNIITNGAQVSAMVQANKNIISSGNLAAQYENLHIQQESISNKATLAANDLKKTIITQYVTVYGDMQMLQFNKEILTLFQNEENILKRLTQANIYKQTDYLTFYVLYKVFNSTPDHFRTGWFVESIMTELFILFIVRTRHSFIKSKPGKMLFVSSAIAFLITILLPYMPFAPLLGLDPLPWKIVLSIITITIAYALTAEQLKIYFFRKAQE